MIAASTRFRENLEKNGRTFNARFLNSYYPEGDDLILTNEQGQEAGDALYYTRLEHMAVLPGDVRSVLVHKGSCGAEQFCIGALYAPYVECVIDNCAIPLENRELILQIGIMVNDDLSNPEFDYINIGYFTVSKPASSSRRCTFTAYGRLSSRCGGLYESALSYPATLSSVMNEVAEQTGLNIRASGLDLSGKIQSNPTGMRHYEVLQTIASLAGGFVTEDSEGGIVLSSYPQSTIAREFSPDLITTDPTFYDNTYTLNGIKCIVSPAGNGEDGSEVEEQSFTWRSGRYQYQNEYMTQELFDIMVENAGWYSYHPGNLPIASGDPRLEAWDVVRYTDINGRGYDVPCMDLVITYDGGISCMLAAPGETDTENNANFAGALTRQIEQISSDVVSAREGAKKAWDYADSAHEAAEEAWDHADEAYEAASDAKEKAAEAAVAAAAAEDSAAAAATAATAAERSASAAEASSSQAAQAARNAESSAGEAADAAEQAQGSAEEAAEAAQEAIEEATEAHMAAAGAQTAAQAAEVSAAEANTHANSALEQLGIVEQVLDVLNYIVEHGTYTLTADTEIDQGKSYFIKSGDTYVLVKEPVAEDLGTYYELSFDESLRNYVAAHLALTNSGLYVLKDDSGYKVLVANDKVQIQDQTGRTVITYGENIIPDSSRPFRIGNSQTYIKYYDSDGDGVPDAIAIIAGSITMGSGMNVEEAIRGAQEGLEEIFDWEPQILFTGTVPAGETLTDRRTCVAHVYRNGAEVTSEIDDAFFEWVKYSETGNEVLGYGKTLEFDAAEVGLNGHIEGVFYPEREDLTLVDEQGRIIVEESSMPIIAAASV